jgi:hypothetical protein
MYVMSPESSLCQEVKREPMDEEEEEFVYISPDEETAL